MNFKIREKIVNSIIDMVFPYEEILYGFGMLQVKLKDTIEYWETGDNALDRELLSALKISQIRVRTLTSSAINNVYSKSMVDNNINIAMLNKMYMTSLYDPNIVILRRHLADIKEDEDAFSEEYQCTTEPSITTLDTLYDIKIALDVLDTKILRRAMYDIKLLDFFNMVREDLTTYINSMVREIVNPYIASCKSHKHIV